MRTPRRLSLKTSVFVRRSERRADDALRPRCAQNARGFAQRSARGEDIVDEQDIPVICYGLRTDFRGELFEGSRELLRWADTIEEIKTVCWCGRKATFNARVQNGHIVREGEQIMMGGNSTYVSLCRRHWKEGNLGSFRNLNL